MYQIRKMLQMSIRNRKQLFSAHNTLKISELLLKWKCGQNFVMNYKIWTFFKILSPVSEFPNVDTMLDAPHVARVLKKRNLKRENLSSIFPGGKSSSPWKSPNSSGKSFFPLSFREKFHIRWKGEKPAHKNVTQLVRRKWVMVKQGWRKIWGTRGT